MSDDAPNPYKSPDFSEPLSGATGTSDGELNSSILTQQRVVAILMIIQGAMSVLIGLFYAAAAVLVPTLIAADLQRQNPNGPNMEQAQWILVAVYGTMGLCGILPGSLQIYAGIQNLWLRGHMLGVVAIASGALTLGTCYCIPTALALMIYGLIIYLHSTTKRAFALAQEGQTFDMIMQRALTRQF
jgi:hypothetical protein